MPRPDGRSTSSGSATFTANAGADTANAEKLQQLLGHFPARVYYITVTTSYTIRGVRERFACLETLRRLGA